MSSLGFEWTVPGVVSQVEVDNQYQSGRSLAVFIELLLGILG